MLFLLKPYVIFNVEVGCIICFKMLRKEHPYRRSRHSYKKPFSFESCMFCWEIKKDKICLLADCSYNNAVCDGLYSVLKRKYKIYLLWLNYCIFLWW
jgi:hypothetical protein